jgi:glucose/arabinose dehydrogenase
MESQGMRGTRPWCERPFASGFIACGTAALLLIAARCGAQTLPTGFVSDNAFPTASFTLPTQLVFLPDGRKLVAEKAGVVWVITAAGDKLPSPLIDLSAKVLSNGDRGLLGVALDPDFASNRWVYLVYTVDPDSNGLDNDANAFSRLERYQLNDSDPDHLDLASRQVLIGIDWPSGIPCPGSDLSHTIGTIRFAQDKSLLLSSGDAARYSTTDHGGLDPLAFGPGRTDPSEDIGAFRAQSIHSMCGKILRVDKDTGHGLPSNPYWDGDPVSAPSRVWLYGLRNAFRFCVRPASGSSNPSEGRPGQLLLGEVGWGTWEELDVVNTGGANLGWPCVEGPFPNNNYVHTTQPPGVGCSAYGSALNPVSPTGPQLWWNHNTPSQSNPPGATGHAIVGGTWYTGTLYPAAYRDRLFFADYANGWIRTAQVDAAGQVVGTQDFVNSGAGTPVDLENDPVTGDIWYVTIAPGGVHRIRFVTGNHDPVASANVGPQYGFAPLAVTFDASASTDFDNDPLSFVWRFGDGDSAVTATAAHTYTVNGVYAVQLDVRDTHGGLDRRAFTIVVGQLAPVAHIQLPVDSSFATPGQVVTLTADPVDTIAGPVTYRWDIDAGDPGDVQLSRAVAFGRVTSFPFVEHEADEPYFDRVRLTVTQGPFTLSDTVYVYPQCDARAGAMAAHPFQPRVGRPFTVDAWVASQDLVAVPEAEVDLLENDIVLASAHLSLIASGDSALARLSVPGLPAGDHLLRVVVDPDRELRETDESNNEGELVVHVRAAGEPFAEWRADAADGSGPYPDGSTTSPWREVRSHHDAVLPAADSPLWRGDRSLASPERLEFAATSAPVALAAPDSLPEVAAIGPASAELWLRTGDDVVRAQTVLEWFDHDSSPWPGLSLGVEAGQLRAWGSPWRPVAPVAPGQWYHVVVSEGLDSLRVFVDGAVAYADGAPVPGAQHSVLRLGASSRGGTVSERFAGAIGAVRLYDDALGQAQARTGFLADSVRFIPPLADAPVRAVVLAADSATGTGPAVTPGAGSPWRDLSGEGHDGVLEAFAAVSDSSGWTGSSASDAPLRLELDGVDDVVTLAPGSIPALQAPPSASVAMWFRPAATLAREQGLLEWNAGDVGRSGLALELCAGRLRLWTAAGWTDICAVAAARWHHVAVAETHALATVWLDGREVWRGFSPALGSQASALVVGALMPSVGGPATAFLRGAVARCELAAGAFRDQDVMALYTAQAAAYVHVVEALPASPSCLGGTRTTVQVPVTFQRIGTAGLIGFSVTLQLSPELQRGGEVVAGSFLDGPASTFFNSRDEAGNTCVVDGVRLGLGCDAPAVGELFFLPVSATVAAGSGTVRVIAASIRDCANHIIPLDLGDPIPIAITSAGPAPVADLSVASVPIPGLETQAVRLEFQTPADAESVTVYRAPYGGYPEYDDVPGTGEPPAPLSDPPPAPWQRTGVHESGHTDLVSTRDAWRYVAFAWDSCGNRSTASAVTAASVNYLLGDARGGATACAGDGVVDALDLAALVSHYGAQPANGDSLACLDYGPTADGRLNGRPGTDDRLDFEDLMLLALDYGATAPDGTPSGSDVLELLYTPPPAVGDTFSVTVKLTGSGRAHGVTASLAWNPAVVTFVSVRPGALLGQQALSSVVLSGNGSRLDAALLGHGPGLTGVGTLASMVFRRVASGGPGIALSTVHGRTATNADLAISIGVGNVAVAPRVVAGLALSEGIPNPFRDRVAFDVQLPGAGQVSLQVYDLLGRRVRTLVDGVLQAGEYHVLWDGRDAGGHSAATGVYFARLWTAGGVRVRRVVLVR